MTLPDETPLVLVANARMPSERAQSLQVAHAAASFARAGVATTLVYAARRGTAAFADAEGLWEHYAVPPGARPAARAVSCIDLIDAFPRPLQYPPARLQELSFARNAARAVRRSFEGARVLSREIETARHLGRWPGLFLEIHRVPGGRLRRRWLRAAAARSAGVLAISAGVSQDLIELGLEAGAIRVGHDAYEPSLFEGLPGRQQAREQLDLPLDRPVVVYAGGLWPWKGVDVLVEAARGPVLERTLVVVVGGTRRDARRLRERAADAPNVRVVA